MSNLKGEILNVFKQSVVLTKNYIELNAYVN